MVACYVNMAIIHSKANAWAKCKRAAERWVESKQHVKMYEDTEACIPYLSALGVDKDNFKVDPWHSATSFDTL